jgi:hypothetical protein
MRTQGTPPRQAYNAQTSVNENQIILAAEITIDAPLTVEPAKSTSRQRHAISSPIRSPVNAAVKYSAPSCWVAAARTSAQISSGPNTSMSPLTRWRCFSTRPSGCAARPNAVADYQALSSAAAGARTQDLRIKSPLLYQLSYGGSCL